MIVTPDLHYCVEDYSAANGDIFKGGRGCGQGSAQQRRKLKEASVTPPSTTRVQPGEQAVLLLGLLEMHAAHRPKEAKGVLPPRENGMHRSEKGSPKALRVQRAQPTRGLKHARTREPAGKVLITACTKHR